MSENTMAFVNCIGISDPEVVAELLDMLLEHGSLTARQASDEIGVSYPLVLKVINNLASRGIVKTSKLKGERGRPRKQVSINKEVVVKLIDDCINRLNKFKEMVLSAPEAPAQEKAKEA